MTLSPRTRRGLGAVAIAAAVVGALGLCGPAGGERGWRVESTVIELGDQPYAMAADGDVVWVSGASGRVLRVRGRDVDGFPHPVGPLGIAVEDGLVWTTSPGGEANPLSELVVFDARTGETVRRVPLPGESPYGIDVDRDAAYAALHDGALLRVDEATGESERVALGDRVTQVLAAHGSVWVSQPRGGVVWRTAFGTRGARATTIALGDTSCPQGSDATDTVVLVADPCAGKVWLLDPRGAVAGELTDVGSRPVDVAAGGGLVYVVSMRDDLVTVLEEATMREVASTRAGPGAIGVVAGPRAAWVANGDERSITKLEVRRTRS